MLPLRPEVERAARAQIERFLPAGDDLLAPAADVPVGFRFPSPRGLLHVDAHGRFELALPGTDAAFFGDLETAFAYPWVAEFGVVALLSPAALSPYCVRARPGWFVCDAAQIVDAEDCVIVPSRPYAERLTVGMRRSDAIAAFGDGYDAVLAALRTRWRTYVDALPRIDARARELRARAASHPDGVRLELAKHDLTMERLSAPTFELTAAQRAALAE